MDIEEMEKSNIKVSSQQSMNPSNRSWHRITRRLRTCFSYTWSKLFKRAVTAINSKKHGDQKKCPKTVNELDCEASRNASCTENVSMYTNGTMQISGNLTAHRTKRGKQVNEEHGYDLKCISYFEPEHKKTKNLDLDHILGNVSEGEPNFQSTVTSDMDSSFETIARRQTQANYVKGYSCHQRTNACSTVSSLSTLRLNSIITRNKIKKKKRKNHKIKVVCVDDFIDEYFEPVANASASNQEFAQTLGIPTEIFCNQFQAMI